MAKAICETDLEISSACLDCCMAPAATCSATEVFFCAALDISPVEAESWEDAFITRSMLWRKVFAVLAEIQKTIIKRMIPDTPIIKKDLYQGKAIAAAFFASSTTPMLPLFILFSGSFKGANKI